VPYLIASAVVIHNEEALYQVYAVQLYFYYKAKALLDEIRRRESMTNFSHGFSS